MLCTLALFGKATIWATFQKIGRKFAKTSGHPVSKQSWTFLQNFSFRRNSRLEACGQYYKLFRAVIMPLAVYFSMILTELRRY